MTKKINCIKKIWFSASVLALSAPAIAQSEPEKGDDLEEIIVTGTVGRNLSEDLSQSATALRGEALDHARKATLGATLDQIPGIAVASFGPAVGRPVIRGLGGDRIRILIGGIGSIDASSTSPDHATAIDAATAERIEVLRGPSTLLYGNNAVGGVINVFDGRIPTRRVTEIDARLNAQYGTNGDEVDSSAWLTMPMGKNQALHIDASVLDRGDMSVGSNAKSRQQLALDGEDANDSDSGKIANTQVTRYKFAAGMTHFMDNGFVGASVSYLSSEYGLPGEGEEGGEDAPIIDLDQYRLDVMGELELDLALIDQLDFRFGYADYRHAELEGAETASVFTNKGWEGRVAASKKSGNLSYAFGVQFKHRNFGAAGEEAFVPDSITDQGGIFGVIYADIGKWLFEAGGRVEHQSVDANATNFSKNYTSSSISATAIRRYGEDWTASFMAFRTGRAPSAEELLSDGPHLATNSFELGNPALGLETATGFEVATHKKEGPITFGAAFFYTYYDDFIYERFTGKIRDGLPIATFIAHDARFWGLELETEFSILDHSDHNVHLHINGDFVNAKDTGTEQALPRIPPLSINAAIDYNSEKIDATIQMTWANHQQRTAPFELASDSNFKLDLSLGYRPYGAHNGLELFIQANNILNSEIRHHTSFLKDSLPEQGRDIKAGFRVRF